MISRPLRVIQLATDARGSLVGNAEISPVFGTAARALFTGFSHFPEEVEVHVVSCVQSPVAAPRTLGANIYFHSLVVPKLGWLRTGYQGCIRAVRRAVRAIQPDLVHAQGTERECAMSGIFSGRPNLVTIHGNMRRLARLSRARLLSFHGITAKLERFVLPRTDGVICITRHTQSEVSALARRTWVVPNATDPDFFTITRNPANPPAVICIGTISPIKNQNGLIRALDQLPLKHFRLIFYGVLQAGDPYCEEFQSLVEQRPWCKHAGFAGRDGLRQVLGEASILALPSFEENCPMVVLEAMSAGVPVVGSRVGGVPDLIEDGITGTMFDPGKPEEIAAAVRRILDQPQAAAAQAITARDRARTRFTPKVVAGRHLEIYRELLNATPDS